MPNVPISCLPPSHVDPQVQGLKIGPVRLYCLCKNRDWFLDWLIGWLISVNQIKITSFIDWNAVCLSVCPSVTLCIVAIHTCWGSATYLGDFIFSHFYCSLVYDFHILVNFLCTIQQVAKNEQKVLYLLNEKNEIHSIQRDEMPEILDFLKLIIISFLSDFLLVNTQSIILIYHKIRQYYLSNNNTDLSQNKTIIITSITVLWSSFCRA